MSELEPNRPRAAEEFADPPLHCSLGPKAQVPRSVIGVEVRASASGSAPLWYAGTSSQITFSGPG